MASWIVFYRKLFLHPYSVPVITWTVVQVEKCVQNKCLEKPPLNRLISKQEAEEATALITSFIGKEHISKGVPGIFQGSKPAICAVIGGAPISKQSGTAEQEKLVEKADVIIRFNVRYPSFMRSEGSSAALGSRTDLLLVQRSALHSLKRFVHGWGQGNATLGNERRKAMDHFQREAPVVVYRHECPGRFRSCVMGWEAFGDSVVKSISHMHLLHPDIEATAYKLLEKRKENAGLSVPTTGMIGIVMALRCCERVHIFAMNGSIGGNAVANSEPVWRGHDLRAERLFIRALESCAPGNDRDYCGRAKIFS
ncbi:unnamed protein product [Agarophyton chilense]